MPRHTPKTVKKFNNKHLKDTIERRKSFSKIKQRNQIKDKRKARHAADNARASDLEDSEEEAKTKTPKKTGPDLKDMSMDDFFQGGFAAVEDDAQSKKKKKAPESKLGKRKRVATQEDDGSDSSDGDDQAFAASSDEDDGAEAEDASEDDETAEHKDQLEALKQKDPEFYKYISENDPELLDLAAGGDTLVLSDDDEPPRKKGKKDQESEEESDGTIVTLAMVKKWAKAIADQNSQAAMREIVLAFRAAAHANEEDGKTFKYTIPDPETYHQVLTTALKGVPAVLAHHLPIKETAAGKVRVPTDSKKYRTLTPLLNSHAISITHLLSNLSEAAALNMVLSSLLSLIPYFLSFKKALKNLVKAVIGIWADSASSEAARINAFLVIRRLAIIGDPSLREAVLKSTYQGLVKSARNTTVHTISGINLMKNSAVELWGLDPGMGYTTGFAYIRQLAIHLRTSITQPSKDSYKAVYNWQYVHSLDFWSRVLSQHCSPDANLTLKKPFDSPLHPLIYPLVQVTLGALRLVPSPVYFPLRFQLTRGLLRMSRSTNTYIPLAPSLLEVLQSPELKKPAKNSTLKPFDFNVNIRAPESYLHTRVYQDGLAEQLSELLAEFFGVWGKNVAFPELIIPPTVLIKRWLKEVGSFNTKGGKSGVKGKQNGKGGKGQGQGNRNGKVNSHFSLLVQKLQANAGFIEERRRKVEFSVSDKKGVENFLSETKFEDTPLGSYIVTMRRQKEEREILLEESRQEDNKRRREEKDVDMDDNRSMSGEEFDEEAEEELEDEDEDEIELEGSDEDELEAESD